MTSESGVLSERLLRKFQRGKPLKFPLNDEATSLAISPTGRFICAGFTDGTVRIFDLTGHFGNGSPKKANQDGLPAGSCSSSNNTPSSPLPRSSAVVDSKRHQRFGAVACQIHAKGVHTSLRMDVQLSEDGLWCFAGVLRGSMELVAIYLGDLQAAYQRRTQQEKAQDKTGHDKDQDSSNLLDHLTVYRHSDAKLRGFGACTRLKNSGRYLLFTGKSIKNIHIWTFDPPTAPYQDPILTQIYDASTNGNTIRFLQFRRHKLTGALQAISKSDDQRLRVWDLTAEEQGLYDYEPDKRPNRPPFQDIPNTEATLAVVGGFCVCGGSNMYNQTSLVSLNVENLLSPYNHTEMALPGVSVSPVGGSRRMQRGDLKSVEAAFGSVEQADHVLLEISDGTLAHYRAGQPKLTVMENLPWYSTMARNMTLGQLAGNLPVAVLAFYQATSGKGQLSVWALEKPPTPPVATMPPTKLAVTSPNKPDENSLVSTAATTPESQMSRQMNQAAHLSSDSHSAESISRKDMGPPEPRATEEMLSRSVIDDVKPVEPAQLIRRFSNGSETAKVQEEAAMQAGGPLFAEKLSKHDTGRFDKSKKLARRFSNESLDTSKRMVCHISNDRPRSAPTVPNATNQRVAAAFTRKSAVNSKAVSKQMGTQTIPSTGKSNGHSERRVAERQKKQRTAMVTAAIPHKQSGNAGKTQTKSSSRSPSPPSEPGVKSQIVTTAPKAVERRPLITPTPGKTWEQFSVDSAAKTLSLLKHSPEAKKLAAETPLLVRRLENVSTAKPTASVAVRSAIKSPLPAPRVLHVGKGPDGSHVPSSSKTSPKDVERTSSPNQTSTADSTYCVTPLLRNKRKSDDSEARTVDDKPDNSLQKRQKKSNLDWLLPNTKFRGRRDDLQMRKSIAKECFRLRREIEKQVESLTSSRATGSLSRTEKLQTEHRAACVFLEKRVWRSVRSLLQSLERSPSTAALRESEELLQQLLRDYKNTAENMICRHEMELSSVYGVHSVSPCQESASFDVSLFDKILEGFPRLN